MSYEIIGIDVGTTLTKISVESMADLLVFPSQDETRLQDSLKLLAPRQIGITGTGADRLQRHWPQGIRQFIEFDAWGAGCRYMLAKQEVEVQKPFLLVSIGTGTSIMSVTENTLQRVGGTAMGGGTLMGLAAIILGVADFNELLELARQGDRKHIDLLIEDICSPEKINLPAQLTAANLAKLVTQPDLNDQQTRSDLAHALLGLVGENIALLSCSLARANSIKQVVFAGGTLSDNVTLQKIISYVCSLQDCQAVFIRQSEFVGSVGALTLAAGF